MGISFDVGRGIGRNAAMFLLCTRLALRCQGSTKGSNAVEVVGKRPRP
jgi:hypothetical protein